MRQLENMQMVRQGLLYVLRPAPLSSFKKTRASPRLYQQNPSPMMLKNITTLNRTTIIKFVIKKDLIVFWKPKGFLVTL